MSADVGWSKERRIILVRESAARAPVKQLGKPRRDKDRQSHLPQATGEGWEACATPWSGKIAVLVSSLDEQTYPVTATAMPRQSRERASAVTVISNELRQIHAISERWTAQQRWTLLLTRLLRRYLGGKWLPGLPNDAHLLLSG
jgi:hypothetical protein